MDKFTEFEAELRKLLRKYEFSCVGTFGTEYSTMSMCFCDSLSSAYIFASLATKEVLRNDIKIKTKGNENEDEEA